MLYVLPASKTVEDRMRKTIITIAAAVSIPAAAIAIPTPAEARCLGCWVGAGIAAGIVAGALASRAYGYGYPAYGYGYPAYGYPPYAYAPAYYGGYAPPGYYTRRKCQENLGYGRTSGWGCG
jgi:hypothetical protein